MTKSPPLDWETIRAVATKKLGVKDNSFFQWKCRGVVPHRWRLPLIEATGGKISARDFAAADQERRAFGVIYIDGCRVGDGAGRRQGTLAQPGVAIALKRK